MKTFSYGYNTLAEKAVRIHKVFFNSRDVSNEIEITSDIQASALWLPSQETTIKFEIEVDEQALQTQLTKQDGDAFFVVLRSNCRGTKKQKSSLPQPLTIVNELELVFNPFEVSDAIDFYIEIFSNFEDDQDRPFGAPVRKYSILFSKKITAHLTGIESRVNVLTKNFENIPGIKAAMWNITLNLPQEIDEWSQLQQSEVVTIEINNKIDSKVINSPEFITLLITDLIYTSLSKFMVDDDRLTLLQDSEIDSESWLIFVRQFYNALFAGYPDPKQIWDEESSRIRSEIQSKIAPSTRKKLDFLLQESIGVI